LLIQTVPALHRDTELAPRPASELLSVGSVD
jgi:hypothetical protein